MKRQFYFIVLVLALIFSRFQISFSIDEKIHQRPSSEQRRQQQKQRQHDQMQSGNINKELSDMSRILSRFRVPGSRRGSPQQNSQYFEEFKNKINYYKEQVQKPDIHQNLKYFMEKAIPLIDEFQKQGVFEGKSSINFQRQMEQVGPDKTNRVPVLYVTYKKNDAAGEL